MKCLLQSALLAVIGFGVASCSSTSSSGGNYGGPGSDWRANLEGGNFTITRAANIDATLDEDFDFTITGTYETLDSGFVFLTVASVEGDGGPDVGDTAYGLEVPGFAFMLKPAGSNQIIPMVQMGVCPTADMSLNWIVTNTDSPDKKDIDTFGTFDWVNADGSATIDGGYSLNDDFAINDEFGEPTEVTGTCDNGVLEITGGGESASIYLNGSGGALVDSGNILVAMPKAEVTAANIDGTYFGIEFYGDGNTDVAEAVQAVISDDGTAIAIKRFTDDALSTVAADNIATVSGLTYNAAGEATVNGFATGTMSYGENADANIVCSVTENAAGSGKNLVFCRSYDADDAPTEEDPANAISFLLRQE